MMSQQMRSSKLEGRALEERGILITEVRAGKPSPSQETQIGLRLMAPDNNYQSKWKPCIHDGIHNL